jgi:hypothetical protein
VGAELIHAEIRTDVSKVLGDLMSLATNKRTAILINCPIYSLNKNIKFLNKT